MTTLYNILKEPVKSYAFMIAKGMLVKADSELRKHIAKLDAEANKSVQRLDYVGYGIFRQLAGISTPSSAEKTFTRLGMR